MEWKGLTARFRSIYYIRCVLTGLERKESELPRAFA